MTSKYRWAKNVFNNRWSEPAPSCFIFSYKNTSMGSEFTKNNFWWNFWKISKSSRFSRWSRFFGANLHPSKCRWGESSKIFSRNLMGLKENFLENNIPRKSKIWGKKLGGTPSIKVEIYKTVWWFHSFVKTHRIRYFARFSTHFARNLNLVSKSAGFSAAVTFT